MSWLGDVETCSLAVIITQYKHIQLMDRSGYCMTAAVRQVYSKPCMDHNVIYIYIYTYIYIDFKHKDTRPFYFHYKEISLQERRMRAVWPR